MLVAASALPESLFWRQNVGVGVTATRKVVRFGTTGQADLLGCLRGRAVAIETKVGKRGLTEKQKKWRAAFVRAGGFYIVGRSVEQVLRELALA